MASVIVCLCLKILISTAQQMTVPVQVQPVYQTNGYTQPSLYTNQSPKNNPCTQLTGQNYAPQSSTTAANNIPYQQLISGINPNEIVKVIFNKVLTSPRVHKVEVPEAATYVNPNKKARKAVPHVVNNYFIVSPEYLKINETVFDEKNDTEKHSKDKVKTKKLKKQNSKEPTDKHMKENTGIDHLKNKTEIDANLNSKEKNVKKKEKKDLSNDKEHSSTKSALDKAPPKSSHSPKNIPIHTLNQDKINSGLLKPIDKPTQLEEPDPTNYFEDIFNQMLSCNDCDSRVTRNLKDDVIVKDFREKFPELPENIARSVLQYVKSKLQSVPYSPSSFPFGYGLYQMPMNYNSPNFRYKIKGKRKKRRRRKSKKRNESRTKHTNAYSNDDSTNTCADYTECDEVEAVTQTQNSLVPESVQSQSTNVPKVKAKTMNKKAKESPKEEIYPEKADAPQKPKLEALKEVPKYEFESVHIKEYPLRDIEMVDDRLGYSEVKDLLDDGEPEYLELDKEEVIPIIHDNRLLEDYSMYDDPASNFKHILQNFNDRHYYTTEQYETEEEREIPYKIIAEVIPKLLRQHLKETKHYKDIENRNILNLLEEYKHATPSIPKRIIANVDTTPRRRIEEFKTPPILEFPDFITKKIDKNILRGEIGEESGLEQFSDVRVKPITEIERVVVTPTKREIETVFANSKVVKYGGDETERMSKDYNDDQVTYVTSKSVLFDDLW